MSNPIYIKNHPSREYCSDSCPNLDHQPGYTGRCSMFHEELKDYDVNAHLVVYKRTGKCLSSKREKYVNET